MALGSRFAQAKERTDLRQLWPTDLVVHIRHRYLESRCPFHGPDDGSLLVYADGFKCQSCGRFGDVYDWLRHQTGQTLGEIVQFLEERPPDATPPRVASRVSGPPKDFDPALITYWHLSLTPAVLAYYLGRGLTRESVARYRLGWGRPPWHRCERYVIPRFWGDQVAGVKFRLASARDPIQKAKYLSWPGFTASYPWTPDAGAALQTGLDRVLITEGEFDAMLGNQLGIYTLSPVGGATAVTREWTRYLDLTPRIYALLDGDSSGEEMGRRLRIGIPRVRLVRLPDGAGDLTEWVQHGAGPDDVNRLLRLADREQLRKFI